MENLTELTSYIFNQRRTYVYMHMYIYIDMYMYIYIRLVKKTYHAEQE